MAEQDTTPAQAADQIQDQSGQSAQGGDAGTQDNGNGGGDKGKPFTPEQEQYIGSWMGRIIKKQFDENVLPHLRTAQQPVGNTESQDDALKDFNAKVTEKLFSGDAVGAMNMVNDLNERARQNITQAQGVALMRGLTTYSDQPFYEDIHQDVQRLAKEKIAAKWPVEAALKASYAEAKADFLEKKVSDGGDREDVNLNLTMGGRHTKNRSKVIKLPPDFEKACARDIADGLYKNRDEWIKSMSPKVKERFGVPA